jgi:hypothetical protein
MHISRFREIELRDFPPLAATTKIPFRDGLTLIAADNGLGKTRIVEAMFTPDSNVRVTIEGLEFRSFPRSLLVADEDSYNQLTRKVWGGGPVEMPGKVDREAVASGISRSLDTLLRQKIGKWNFESLAIGNPTFHVSLDENYRISISSGEPPKNMRRGFEAMGEQVVLHLALVDALRRNFLPDRDLPFVVDSFLGVLDVSLCHSAVDFVSSMSGQVVFLANWPFFNSIRRRPHYVIRQVPGTDRSEIVKVSSGSQ